MQSLGAAEKDSDAMDAIAWRLNKEKGDDKVDNPKGALTILEIYSLDLRGNMRAQQGRYDEAIDLLKRAVDKEEILGYAEPPRYARPELEALGYVYLKAKKFDEAREAFKRELKQRPNSGFALFGIAKTYEAQGNRAEAGRAYREFLEAWKSADDDLAMVGEARSALRQ